MFVEDYGIRLVAGNKTIPWTEPISGEVLLNAGSCELKIPGEGFQFTKILLQSWTNSYGELEVIIRMYYPGALPNIFFKPDDKDIRERLIKEIKRSVKRHVETILSSEKILVEKLTEGMS